MGSMMNSGISTASIQAVNETPASQTASSDGSYGSTTSQLGSMLSIDDTFALAKLFRVYHNCRNNLTIDEFLAQHLLCQDGLPDPPALNMTGFFTALAQPLSEEAMHDSLVSGLTKLVEDLPIDCRPRFQKMDRTRSVTILHSSHHNRFPETDNSSTCIWDRVIIVSEANQAQDPIDANGFCKNGFRYIQIRSELLKNALNLLKQHKSSYVFTLGIYGPTFRIFRFDRLGVISSVAVDYVTSPQMLRKFLWLVVQHQKDISKAFSGHHLAKVSFTQDLSQVESDGLFHSKGLFSRSSVISTTIPHHNKEQIYVLKDFCHKQSRSGKRLPGIQKIIQDEFGDLSLEPNVPALLSLSSGDTEEHSPPTKIGCVEPATVKACNPSDLDCHGIRTLSVCAGQDLTSFKCTKQLVYALRDVVIGLAVAHHSGVIHGDVSVGNILLHQCKPGGFLHDFDYSPACISTTNPHPRKLKHKTGTWPFVAMDILDNEKEDHHLRHDLESIYWVLIWCLSGHRKGNHAAQWLFDPPPQYRRQFKLAWVVDQAQALPISGDTALANLSEDLRALVESNFRAQKSNDPAMELTPRKVLEAMNKALSQAESNWPCDTASMQCEILFGVTAQTQKTVQPENGGNSCTSKALQSASQIGASSHNPGQQSEPAPSDGKQHDSGTPSAPAAPPNFASSKRKRSAHPNSSNKVGRTFNPSPLNVHEEDREIERESPP